LAKVESRDAMNLYVLKKLLDKRGGLITERPPLKCGRALLGVAGSKESGL